MVDHFSAFETVSEAFLASLQIRAIFDTQVAVFAQNSASLADWAAKKGHSDLLFVFACQIGLWRSKGESA